MKLKRLIVTVLVFALAISLGGMASAASTYDYSDLPAPGSWNYDAFVSMIENGVITGEGGMIKPSEFITVGDLYKYASNALGVTLAAPSGTSGIATRQELFVLLAEVTGAELSPHDNVSTFLGGFVDNASVASSARTPIAALIKAGYINGVVQGGVANLYPANQLTRSEFAVLAHRIFGQFVNSPGTISSNVGNITVRSPGVTFSNATIAGDLIIGGSAGRTIDVTLNNTTIQARGRTIVRGPATITANIRSLIGTVHNYDSLTFSGDATTINVRGSNSTIRTSGGYFRDLNIESDNNTVTIGSGSEIRFLTVDGNGNDISGAGTVQNASFGGRNNKLDIPGTNIVNAGTGNNLSVLSGNFNITSAQITGNTTIAVTFDAAVQAAPASAFTLTGTARNRTQRANPDSTSISGSTVTLTFNGATFNAIGGATTAVNVGTITATDAVTSSEKARLNTKSINIGWGSGLMWNPEIEWGTPNGGDAARTSVGTRHWNISINTGSSTSIPFWTGAYSVAVSPSVTGVGVDYNQFGYGQGYGGYCNYCQSWYCIHTGGFLGGHGGTHGFGTFYHSGDARDYNVNRDSAGMYFYTRNNGTRVNLGTDINAANSNWYRSGHGGYGGHAGGNFGYGTFWHSDDAREYSVNRDSAGMYFYTRNNGTRVNLGTDFNAVNSNWYRSGHGGGIGGFGGEGSLNIGVNVPHGTVITVVSRGDVYSTSGSITYTFTVQRK